jgi:AraC-like DNA-binding protein
MSLYKDSQHRRDHRDPVTFDYVFNRNKYFSPVDRKMLLYDQEASDRGGMEDPLGQARRALYALTADSDGTGLFTRPAILALSDETSSGLPIRALNRACRKLMTIVEVSETGASSVINSVASECGFDDTEIFIALFQTATGWHPDEWQQRFGRGNMPIDNDLSDN